MPGDDDVADAFERLILEAYKLLQEGEMERAELLLMEGALYSLASAPRWACGDLASS